ncbi:zinc-dependent metalloprotease [Epilithonimonas hungarica]|uniref:Por secretion system C-terminal sorting domain-containing protein n=1 Tax=Epilithonimonas hungarica TaxID=454006 RepID=A0A1G7GBA8_9FLAO|nr:zinc-dependent metalloprotease [Epilithonimonas hungarica]SDE85387.1 Por secretion system C-terminal sorting domain-containing protein [Epilithonimonas hungarica]
MKKVLSLALVSASLAGIAQTGKLWKKTTFSNRSAVEENLQSLKNPSLYALDHTALKSALQRAPKSIDHVNSKIILSFPNSEGEFEDFRIYEKSNFEPALQEKYADIRSYVGESVFGDSKIYFSVSQFGLSTMEMRSDRTVDIIEPYTADLSSYVVFKRTDDKGIAKEFECKVPNLTKKNSDNIDGKSADDGLLRTYRLALSCTGEYGAWAGSVANALARMNTTMTRVNGVFENEFSIHMNLIAEEENIIFTSASTDPYSSATAGASGAWNDELKAVLMGSTYGIGDAKYDIGHLFGRTGGGGSAGCIGCVCDSSNTYDSTYQWYKHKGQGFTSPGSGTPVGDNFDIDYVAHEMGHQFGGWHTFTHGAEGNPSQMEPGSGSTIMGYAGITAKDVQAHSDAYFHSASIRDITNYMKTTLGNCSVNTSNGNTAPVANAGADYTIPKSTPFMLTGSATDANGDALTYDWEQFDLQNSSTTNPTATKTSGVNFRSYSPTTSPTRYFPNMTTILTGNLFTAATELNVEYLPSVARTLNFRLTVRDNKTGGGANAYDDMKVTVNAASGPFKVTVPNTAVTYAGASTQTITWDVASTTASPVSCANVDILISTDGGTTWSTLATSVPNDGSESVILPNLDTTTARIMVKANGNIFFDVSDANFTITKTNLAVSDVNTKSVQIYPNPVKDVLNVSNASPSSSYEIFNTAGQIVSKGTLSTGKVMVNKLTKGVYFINIDNNGIVVKTKFVKD